MAMKNRNRISRNTNSHSLNAYYGFKKGVLVVIPPTYAPLYRRPEYVPAETHSFYTTHTF